MGDDPKIQLPAKVSFVRPPLWGNLMARTVSDIAEGELVLRFTNGAERTIKAAQDGARAVLDIAKARSFRRMLLGGEIGFAESYLDGDWTSPDLASVFEFGSRNMNKLAGTLTGIAPLEWARMVTHKLRSNTRKGSRKNIAAHYDLGNAFYSQWLDPTMTYSSAVFENPDQNLEDAQRNKWRKLADMLDLKEGMHILEIGCGWGGFAMFAAREYGCKVTGITLSTEQLAFAKKAAEEAQLSHLLDFQLIDYRDVLGTYDRIVSIEMFEAVGEEHWPAYFKTIRDRLKPGGVAALQI